MVEGKSHAVVGKSHAEGACRGVSPINQGQVGGA